MTIAAKKISCKNEKKNMRIKSGCLDNTRIKGETIFVGFFYI